MKKTTILWSTMVLCLCMITLTACDDNVKEKETDEQAEMAEAAEPEFDDAAKKNAIVGANKIFMARFTARDSAGVADLYTPDAKVMMTGSPAITGSDNISATFGSLMNAGIDRALLTTIGVWGTDEWLTEEGTYTLFSGDQQVDQGKYMVLWKNVDGQWKLFRDIFNSDLAAE